MKNAFGFLLIGLLAISACNDPTIVGSDLLVEEGLDVDFTDTVDLVGKTITVDSVRTYAIGTSVPNTYMLGQLDDPFFGRTKGALYSEVHLGTTLPNYENATFDSLVLILAYDTIGFYGDDMDAHRIEVFRMLDRIDERDSIFSNETFNVEALPIGILDNFRPNALDSLTVNDHVNDSLVRVAPQIRVRLDDLFGTELMMDTAAAQTDSALVELVHGLFIQSETNNALIGLDINGLSNTTRMTLYYTEDDGDRRGYSYFLTGRRSALFEHDYAGAQIEPFLDDTAMGDSLLFVQAMSGTNIEFDLSGAIDFISDKLINKADLEFYVAESIGDNTDLYPPVRNLLASRVNSDGNVVLIQDAAVAAASFGGLEVLFGGVVETVDVEGMMLRKYSMNITNHIQNLGDGEVGPELIVSVFLKTERPNRSIIFGPGHSMYPAKLKLTFTTL